MVPDFPKKGILYKDITPLLLETKAVDYCLREFIKRLDGKKIDKVGAIESRGFFFGMLLAKELNAGFAPIRKKGKLPYNTLQESYEFTVQVTLKFIKMLSTQAKMCCFMMMF